MNNVIEKINNSLNLQMGLVVPPASHREETQTLTQKILLKTEQLPVFLNIIKNGCRENALSFVFDNKSPHNKLLTLITPSSEEIAIFHIMLSNKGLSNPLIESNEALTGNRKTRFPVTQLRRHKLLTNNFISLIGPDGVGKTTISSAIQQAIPAKTFRYKRTYRRSFIYKALYLLRRRKQLQKNDYDDLYPNKVLITSLLRLYVHSLSSFLSRKTILCDRYSNDNLASQLRAKEPAKASSRMLRKSRFIPAPKTIIQLDAPAETILSRRAELSEDTINFLSDFYLESSVLIKPKKFIYLNTNIPFERTQKLVLKLLSI
ncbi:hypothetical protein [Marinomonas pollencensis]|uniref:Thymidylate kinase n=1 Tax=Marinomonas pollencensis TaxID=491954 RepID=A0A3E0DVS0_9GAMM|nr:hypothetical protein [Marinomonas pollencensis]REG87008.1 thymidylate kinase [Marinomonas pollencensis]